MNACYLRDDNEIDAERCRISTRPMRQLTRRIPVTRRFAPPCIPTRAHNVPVGPDWVHEIKQDGYRLEVRRAGDMVRPFIRRVYDWSGRYPSSLCENEN
jgi:ATP-dependent DNA ligase